LQELIEKYNIGAENVDVFYEQLLLFTLDLDKEEQRFIAENLGSEEELAIFDLLTKPGPPLTDDEVEQVRAVAQELLGTLKTELLVLDWRKRQQARAAVEHAIEVSLDQLPTSYDSGLYKQKCQEVYNHVYEAYHGEGRSIYSAAA
jgi:type I restriction enzyme R subunit